MTIIGRVDDGDSRWYVDPLDGSEYASVTYIIGRTESKPWLAPWAAGLAAQYAGHNLRELLHLAEGEAGVSGVVALIKDVAKRKRELKAEVGTFCHDVIEALILDTPIPTVPEHLVDVEFVNTDGTVDRIDLDEIIDGYLQFNEDFRPRYLLAEATVVNVEHRYAGTLDIAAEFPTLGGRVGIIDVKSGAVLGASMGAQLAAYRNATEVWLDHLGNRAPMPRADFSAVLHLRTKYQAGYKLLEASSDAAAFEWFLAARTLLAHAESAPKITGRPLYPALPDGSQPPMLIEDVEHEGFRRTVAALASAGVENVEDLSCLTIPEVLALKGIGTGSVAPMVDVLAIHGLAFSGAQPCPGEGEVVDVAVVARKVVGHCPSCGQQVSADRKGVIRFHLTAEQVAA